MTAMNNAFSTKKGPTTQPNNSQVFKKDGTRNCSGESIDHVKTRLPDEHLQNRDNNGTSSQDNRGQGENKSHVDGVGKPGDKEKPEENDSNKKRRGPLLPLPTKATKDDAIRYIECLYTFKHTFSTPHLCFIKFKSTLENQKGVNYDTTPSELSRRSKIRNSFGDVFYVDDMISKCLLHLFTKRENSKG